MLLTFNIGSSSFVSIYFDVNVAYFVKGTGLVFSQLFLNAGSASNCHNENIRFLCAVFFDFVLLDKQVIKLSSALFIETILLFDITRAACYTFVKHAFQHQQLILLKHCCYRPENGLLSFFSPFLPLFSLPPERTFTPKISPLC